MKLEDIIPKDSEFYLAAKQKNYRVRKIGLADKIWLRQVYGDRIQSVLASGNMAEVCKIVFHQLFEEDKKDFAASEEEFMDEEGITSKKLVGGAALLMKFVNGTSEEIAMLKALIHAIGISEPMLSELEKEELKKNEIVQNEPPKPIGEKSSTDSQANTVGQLNTSSP